MTDKVQRFSDEYAKDTPEEYATHDTGAAVPGMFPSHALGANPVKTQGTQWATAKRIESTFHDRRGR